MIQVDEYIFFNRVETTLIDRFLGFAKAAICQKVQRSNCWNWRSHWSAGMKGCKAKVVCGVATGLVVSVSSTESHRILLSEERFTWKFRISFLTKGISKWIFPSEFPIGCRSSTFDIRFLLMICTGLAWEKSFAWAVKQDRLRAVSVAGWWTEYQNISIFF